MKKALAAKVYFIQSETFKDLLRYLFFCTKKVKKGEWSAIFPSVPKMAKACQCSERTVQRFLKAVDGFPIKITKRTGETHILEMDEDFFNWMHWANLKNLLYATQDRIKDILKQCEREDEFSTMSPPPSSMECHPTLTLSRTRIKEKGVHPYLEKIEELAFNEKLSLSQNSEAVIVGAVENYLRFKRLQKISSPHGLMISYLQRQKRKRL